MNNITFPTSFCLRVGKHKGLISGTEFCRNTTIQRIFLEPSDCRSRSNWPSAAKIQRNVCLMFGKVQRDWCHPCSMSRAKPFSSRTRGIVSEAGIPVVWFPGTALSLFNWVLRSWKSWMWMRTLFPLSFFAPCLYLCVGWNYCLDLFFLWVSAESTLLEAFITCRKAFLASFWNTKHNLLLTTILIHFPVLSLHQRMLFWFLFDPPLLLPFWKPSLPFKKNLSCLFSFVPPSTIFVW